MTTSQDKRVRVHSLDIAEASACCDINVEEHDSGVFCCTQLQSGHCCTGSGDKTIKVWELNGNDKSYICCILTIDRAHTDFIRQLVQLEDGRLVSTADDRCVCVWDVDTDNCEHIKLKTFQRHGGRVLAAAALADGRVITGASNGGLYIWSGPEQ